MGHITIKPAQKNHVTIFNPRSGGIIVSGNVEAEDKPELGKLLFTLNKGKQNEGKYLVLRDVFETPATPTITPASGTSGNGSLTISLATTTSGATIKYSLDNGVTWQTGSSITLSQDDSVQSKTYSVKAKAVKDGLESEIITASYSVARKVATPTATASGNKYSASREITFACSTADATIEYKVGSGEWTEGSSVTINATSTVYFRAKKNDWATSAEDSQSFTLNANKCYIGQAASVTTESDIKALANAYERDTMVGWTAPTIDFGSTTEYVWFAIPSTAAKNLTIKSSGFGVTLDNAAGTVIGSYRVWRTANKINSSFTFEFI